MTEAEYKQILIERIKNVGAEIIRRAEQIASADTMIKIDIHATLGGAFDAEDTFEWTTEVINKSQYKDIMGER